MRKEGREGKGKGIIGRQERTKGQKKGKGN